MKKIFNITSSEIAKFSLTSAMMILTLYIYSILRGTKDALIIAELGAELISTLKLYGVLPCAILIMLAYTKLVDYVSKVASYHIVNFFFICFFTLFDLVLYPNASSIHFDISYLAENYQFLKYPLVMIGHWSYSLFYIMSELWGSVMLSLMFWQLANQIHSIDEAKRFYPLFGFFGQIGLLASGMMMALFTTYVSDWKASMHYVCLSVLISGIFLHIIFYVLSKHITGYAAINDAPVKRKEKPGLIKSLKYVFTSKYIGYITLLVICYGVSINLVEGVWKKQMGNYFTSSYDIGNFMAKIQIYTAIATFSAMLMGSYLLKIYKWRTAALFTPIIILLTGIPFFIITIYSNDLVSILTLSTTSLLFIAVMFGSAQNVLSKAIKYSFFDPTKEMAYIPLDSELKAKGKAAADVIGGRLGKSGGAVIQWLMLSFIAGSTLTSLAPSLFVIFTIISFVWIFAVFGLYTQYKSITSLKQEPINS